VNENEHLNDLKTRVANPGSWCTAVGNAMIATGVVVLGVLLVVWGAGVFASILWQTFVWGWNLAYV
jgi:hypothetical protein